MINLSDDFNVKSKQQDKSFLNVKVPPPMSTIEYSVYMIVTFVLCFIGAFMVMRS